MIVLFLRKLFQDDSIVYHIVTVQLIQTIIKKMISFKVNNILASTTNNNLQDSNMPKYGFAVLMFLFSIKDMCLLDIICHVANPENAV